MVVPSDHIILDEEKFLDTVRCAYEYVKTNGEAAVTIGIKPTRPEIGYGYIKYEESKNYIKRVESFKEKPSIEKAREYLEDGNYLWNSGMFVWKAERILELTKCHLKNTYDNLNEVAITLDVFEERLKDNYKRVDNISVDYAIMEKAEEIYVVLGEFGWDDLGSWNSLSRYKKSDKDDNVIDGSVIVLKCKNDIIKTQKKTYVMGAENLIIIETDNEIMILNREYVSHIKELKNYKQY